MRLRFDAALGSGPIMAILIPLIAFHPGVGGAAPAASARLDALTARSCVDTGQFIVDGFRGNELSDVRYDVSMTQTDAQGVPSRFGEYLTVKNRRAGAIRWSASDNSGGAIVRAGTGDLHRIGPHPSGIVVNLDLCQ